MCAPIKEQPISIRNHEQTGVYYWCGNACSGDAHAKTPLKWRLGHCRTSLDSTVLWVSTVISTSKVVVACICNSFCGRLLRRPMPASRSLPAFIILALALTGPVHSPTGTAPMWHCRITTGTTGL